LLFILILELEKGIAKLLKNKKIEPPFFEIGPKAYMYGEQAVELAKFIDKTAVKYDVRVIFTPQPSDIYRIATATSNILVFAQHMDALEVGRGQGAILPEAVKAAGAVGVMLNHAEKPLTFSELNTCIRRAEDLDMYSIVCADSLKEAVAIAGLNPDMIVCEPTELIGSGQIADKEYMDSTLNAVRSVNPDILILQGAGISNGNDVYNVMLTGAEATGTTSGIMKAQDKQAMVEEMLSALRKGWDDFHNK